MSYPAQELQPNTLYLTISTPEAPATAIAHIYDVDMTWLQGALAAPMEGADNFEWGIYWHRGHQDGTWYMMHSAGDPELPTYQLGLKMKHPFKSMEMRQSPRLHHHVVGLIRLMRITRFGIRWLDSCRVRSISRLSESRRRRLEALREESPRTGSIGE